ncbi:hypothetical protein NPIL_26681 [Nephila pilipes]|uniref:Uncharacterized protein n=1 Tax=Nephila pilipes TaxID=299642 RepID=A0A8X6NBV9_NEPPI|nr:hypothetical protein NPIL_26681 [Nephila pilipes]
MGGEEETVSLPPTSAMHLNIVSILALFRPQEVGWALTEGGVTQQTMMNNYLPTYELRCSGGSNGLAACRAGQ